MELEKLNVDKPPASFSQDEGGNSRLVFDLMLVHKRWREKSKDSSKYSDVTLTQLEEYASALEAEMERRDIKIPTFNDDMMKVWSESAREAAIEARRAKANPAESIPEHTTKLHYALMPRATIERVKADIENLPPEHTKDVSDVYILRNIGSVHWTDSRGQSHSGAPVCGDYNPRTGTIRARDLDIRMAGGSKRVLFHEFGHSVYERVLTGDQRSNWENSWSHGAKMPNSYANSHPEEGFAECYKEYQSRKPLESKVETWFKDNVKRKGA